MGYSRRHSARAMALFGVALLLLLAAGPVVNMWRARGVTPPANGSQALAPTTAATQVKVSCSLNWLADIVRLVGGQRVAVTVLLPANADPHTFEPKPSQAAEIAAADLALAVGGGLDHFMDTLRAAAKPGLRLIRLTEAIDSAFLVDGGKDPHLWLDPTMIRDHVLGTVLDELVAADPAGEDEFIANANALALLLTDLDEWIAQSMEPFRGKGLITVHQAWAYFGRRYDIPVWAVQSGHGGEPSARYVTELLEIAGERSINTLFREPNSPDLGIGALVRSLGGQVMILDPLGGPDRPGYGTYFEMMRTNVGTIVRGLSGS